jgi:hypothetical protein
MFVLTLIERVKSIPTLHFDPCPSLCLDTRTIWSILLSSLVTIFVCIWVVVRPNVPAFGDEFLARIKQRAMLLLTAVIALELIALFAMRQWVCAREVMKTAEIEPCVNQVSIPFVGPLLLSISRLRFLSTRTIGRLTLPFSSTTSDTGSSQRVTAS